MKPLSISCFILSAIFSCVFAQVPNDSCATATQITSISSLQSISINYSGATESLKASCEIATETNLDLWYHFTMPYDGKVKISGLSSVNRISLYDSCGSTELLCLRGGGFLENLSAGISYLLRIAIPSQYAGQNTLYVQAFSPPANDLCNTALSLTHLETQQSVFLDTRGANESLDASCENAADENFDIWYSFMMPFDGKLKFTGLSVVHKLSLYESCGGNEIACRAGNGFIKGLTGGETYLLRYASASSHAGANTMYVQAFAPPANDFCNDAISVGDIRTAQTIDLETRGASESLDASCEVTSNENLDLWYNFTMPFSGKVKISGVFGVNRITLFDACGGNELACKLSSGFFEDLDSGISYFLRYAAISEQAHSDQITIQAFSVPSNDTCSQPLSISDLESRQVIQLDTRQATESLDASCEDANDENLDLWYSFVMPFDGNLKVEGVFGVNKLALFQTCGGTELDCFAGNGFFNGLTGDTTYFMRYAAISQQAISDEINVQAFPSTLNDVCSQAIALPSIESLQHILLDTRLANESLDASCEDSTNDNLDLWYSFTMPFDGKIVLDGLSTVRRIVIYEQCGGNELGCLQGSGALYGFKENVDYILRYSTLSSQAAEDQFSIQAFMPPDHDECSSALDIFAIDSLQYIHTDIREATQSLRSTCEDSSFTHNDLWYKFRMPFAGSIQISEANNAHRFSLWDSCGGEELGCFSGAGIFDALQDSVEYLLRYSSMLSTAQKDSFLIQAVMAVGVEDIQNDMISKISIYPNPIKNQLFFELEISNAYPIHLFIYDISGKLVWEQDLMPYETGKQRMQIPLSGKPSGIYLLHVRIGQKLFSRKFMKE